ncbi:MAG TPA: transposase, partial [Candidatus Acidoferrales bacterium]|nr:transposase [Candidatus Acidoferrales bacterium]
MGTTGAHFRRNLLSAVSAHGQLRFMVITGWVNGAVFLAFLQRLTHNQKRPVLVITDNRPAHRSQSVARYLASIQGRL